MNKAKENDISTVALRRRLKAVVAELGGPAAAGREWGVPAQHIGSAMSGAKLPSKPILNAIDDDYVYVAVKTISYRYLKVKK